MSPTSSTLLRFPIARSKRSNFRRLGRRWTIVCRISELLLGGPPSGDTGLTIGIMTILSFGELAVSAVYTATPLSGDGISIDVEYIPARPVGRGGPD